MSDDAERAPPATVVERERGPSGDGADETEVTVEITTGDADLDGSVAELDDAALEAELKRLQRKLERREAELQDVVGRYERVLERRERARERQQKAVRERDEGPVRQLARRLRRWLDNPRRR